MKKISLFLLFLFGVLLCHRASAQLYKGQGGKIRFFSDAVIEDIEAVTTKAGSALNLATGEVAILIPIKSFEFDKTLMKEHFNDNYMESDKFPTATFQGKVKLPTTLTQEQVVNVTGTLKIHGVAQERVIAVKLKQGQGSEITASGKFMVKLEDHKIKIPRLVFQNIAEAVEVSFDLILNQSAK